MIICFLLPWADPFSLSRVEEHRRPPPEPFAAGGRTPQGLFLLGLLLLLPLLVVMVQDESLLGVLLLLARAVQEFMVLEGRMRIGGGGAGCVGRRGSGGEEGGGGGREGREVVEVRLRVVEGGRRRRGRLRRVVGEVRVARVGGESGLEDKNGILKMKLGIQRCVVFTSTPCSWRW